MDFQIKNPYFPLADPFLMYYNGVYYLYGTTEVSEQPKNLNDFSTSDIDLDGIYVYTSNDLLNWKKEGLCLKKGDVIGEKWFWAPEVAHYKGKFYMAYAAEEHIAIAVADSPLGPFKQQEKKWLPEAPGIDGHFFFDDDGTPYFYYVGFNEGNRIYVATLTDDLLHIKQDYGEIIRAEDCYPWECKDCFVAEGPFVVKHNGTYFLTYSANHTRSPEYAVGCAISKSPTGPFVKYEGNPILHKNKDFRGVGHHSFCFVPGKEHFLCSFHCHNPNGEDFRPRTFCLTTARFESRNGKDILVIDEPKKG